MGEIGIGGGVCESLLATQLTDEEYKHRQEFLRKNQWERIKSVKTNKKETPICEKCGIPMVIKNGKFGEFWGCPNYPKCKNTKSLILKNG